VCPKLIDRVIGEALIIDRFGVTELAKQHDMEAGHDAPSMEKISPPEIQEDTVHQAPAARRAEDKEVQI